MDKKIIALSIPTGIGCDIGGYAGDFGYVAREFSSYFHCIVNPNAVNGGILSAINYDMSYLEGYLFDEFFNGSISIIPKKPYEVNKIGVIFDCAIKKDILNVHLNTLSALKMVQGIEASDIIYTKKPMGISLNIDNGISSGGIENPWEIINCAQQLIDKKVEAIAIIGAFGDDSEDEMYENASGIDPIGGIEAVISHLITSKFKIPCAHAPAFNDIDIELKIANPKVASELISSTYLPCIMQGLSIAPKIDLKGNGISYKNVEYLIVPYNALGSSAVLNAQKNNIKIITVENKTVLNVTSEKLNIKPYKHFKTYFDCLEFIKNN